MLDKRLECALYKEFQIDQQRLIQCTQKIESILDYIRLLISVTDDIDTLEDLHIEKFRFEDLLFVCDYLKKQFEQRYYIRF